MVLLYAAQQQAEQARVVMLTSWGHAVCGVVPRGPAASRAIMRIGVSGVLQQQLGSGLIICLRFTLLSVQLCALPQPDTHHQGPGLCHFC